MTRKKIIFNDCPKQFTTDQDKAVAPEQTLARFYEKIKSLDLKIVNEIRRVDTGRLDIPVYFSVCGEDAAAVTGTKKQMGKGASEIQAEASACMELAERFSFFSYINDEKNFLVGDYQSMEEQGYPVLDPRFLLKSVSDERLEAKELVALLKDIPMQWVWGTNVTKDEEILIPFSWFFAINEFNGPSAGNTVEEAALQGLCEIVERDVCGRVTNGRLSTPKILAESITDPVALQLLAKFADNGILIHLHDFTLNTGVCTVAALAMDPSTFPDSSEIVYTAGTSPNPEKAIIRAITEVAQLAGDFNSSANYVASGLPKPASIKEMQYLNADPKTISVEEMANLSEADFKAELSNCIDSLEKVDFEVLMVDVTHKELQIPALYTIIPGAQFRERSMSCDAALFAAKLLVERVENPFLLEDKLMAMEQLLPNAYYLQFYRGKNLLEQDKQEAAIVFFEKALTLEPAKEDLPYILSYLGISYKDLGEYDKAIEILLKGLQEDYERPDIHNAIGVCYFKKEMYQKAIEHFTAAVDFNPASAIDYANLGVNYSRLGENEKAKEFLTLALTLDPGLDFAKDLLERLTKEL